MEDATARRWIPIEDELPPADGYYLTYRPGCEDNIVTLYYFSDDGQFEGVLIRHVSEDVNEYIALHEVTHWMPLPIPPTQDPPQCQ